MEVEAPKRTRPRSCCADWTRQGTGTQGETRCRSDLLLGLDLIRRAAAVDRLVAVQIRRREGIHGLGTRLVVVACRTGSGWWAVAVLLGWKIWICCGLLRELGWPVGCTDCWRGPAKRRGGSAGSEGEGQLQKGCGLAGSAGLQGRRRRSAGWLDPAWLVMTGLSCGAGHGESWGRQMLMGERMWVRISARWRADGGWRMALLHWRERRRRCDSSFVKEEIRSRLSIEFRFR